MAISQFNMPDKQYAERKQLITVAEWKDENGSITIGSDEKAYKVNREILGTRTEESSIEYNNDMSQTTDIRGINYADLNKTQPQQTFDPYLPLGGSKLGPVINDIRRRNALTELNQFTAYIITAYVGTAGAYEAEKHDGCTIMYTALGGDTKVNMPIELHLSNDSYDSNGKSTGKIALGTVDKLSDDFVFTPTTVG